MTFVAIRDSNKEFFNITTPPNPNFSSSVHSASDGRIYISGFLGENEHNKGDVKSQTKEILAKVDQVLNHYNISKQNIVDGICFITDTKYWGCMS